ncbi:MAG: DNA cytosine methyltransferase [Christensenellales bacterium]
MDGKPLDKPLPTLTTSAGHFAQITTYLEKIDTTQDLHNWDKVRALLNEYAGYNIADDEILIIEINGEKHFISDVGMRMLKAKELMLAQGFPIDYVLDIESAIGKKYCEAKQIARMGNAVCPPVAEALIRANCPDMANKTKIKTMEKLTSTIEKVRKVC